MKSFVYNGGVTKTESALQGIPLSNVLVLKMDSNNNFLNSNFISFSGSDWAIHFCC